MPSVGMHVDPARDNVESDEDTVRDNIKGRDQKLQAEQKQAMIA